jgi:hypothetical protein
LVIYSSALRRFWQDFFISSFKPDKAVEGKIKKSLFTFSSSGALAYPGKVLHYQYIYFNLFGKAW